MLIRQEKGVSTTKKILSLMCGLVLIFVFAKPTSAVRLEVVSDSTTQWSTDGVSYKPTVAAWVLADWNSIPGATWIWRTKYTNARWEYDNVPAGGWYFKKTFRIPRCASILEANIEANSDNSHALYFNGYLMGQEGTMQKDGPDRQEWRDVISTNIWPRVGENTILFRALNYYRWGTYFTNPAGLAFKATVFYEMRPECLGDKSN